MKVIFWFLFESSPKKKAMRELQKLYYFMEGVKHQQKFRRKLPRKPEYPDYPFFEPYKPKTNQ